MKNLQTHIRNYKLTETKLNKFFSTFFVSDQYLDQPSPNYSSLIHDIVPNIESLARDLHEELSNLPQFSTLPKFKAGESFDYKALAFLDKALRLSNKQVKITSDLVVLSDDKRLITPLKGAHEKDKSLHPLWSVAYQSYKHDQANTQNQDPTSNPTPDGKAVILPTLQALIEAAGANFLLLTVAKSLPLTREVPYNKCDFKFDSNIFTATYARPLFSRFLGPMSKDCLQFFPNWEQKLFVVKDPERYIVHLRAKIKENNQQIKDAILSNIGFLSFFSNLSDDLKRTPIEMILQLYAQETKDPVQKEWVQRVQDLSFSIHTSYYIGWANNYSDHLRLSGFAPVVALNYQDADHLYDYEKLSQDSPDSK